MVAKLTTIDECWSSQPQIPVRISAKYAKALTVFNAATPRVNLATGKEIIVSGAPIFGESAEGRSVHSSVYTDPNWLEVRSGINPSTENWPGVTLIWSGVLGSISTTPGLMTLLVSGSYNGGWNIQNESSSTSLNFYAGNSASGLTLNFSSTIVNRPVTIVAVWDRINGTRSFQLMSGTYYLKSSGSHSVAWTSGSMLENIGGYYRSGNRSAPHKVSLACVLPYAVSDEDVLSLLKNPWQIFDPETFTLFYSTVTAQYARPTSDVSAGTWTASTGSDLFAMLDETTASDSDYIITTGASTCEVALGTLSDPSSSSGHVVRYRISADSGGITVRLRQGTTTIATWTHASAPTSLTTYAQTLTSGEADSITNYSALKLQFEAT